MRCLLIPLIVAIHTNLLEDTAAQGTGYETGYLLAGRVLWLANPLFYLLSGYLFFRHYHPADYLPKLQRRIHSYLIPYLLWNTLYLAFFLSATLVFPSLMGAQGIRISDLSLKNLWKVYVCYYGEGVESTPLDGPLWFLRNLIVVTLLSPLLHYGVRLHRLSIIPLLCIPMLPIGTEAITTLTYYGLGAYLASWKIDFIALSRRLFVPCTCLFASLSVLLVLGNPPMRILLDTFSVLCGMAMLTALCARATFFPASFHAQLFFIYASHGILARLLTKTAANFLLTHQIDASWYGLIHLANLLLVLEITHLLSLCFGHYFPRFSRLLGNRK